MEIYKHLEPRGVRHKAAAQIYYATVTELDKQIGIFLDKLKKLGLADNTVIIFSSDNGPEDIQIRNASYSGVGSAGPFRGRKRSVYEGGIRVPFIVRWPRHVPAGKIDNTSVIGGVDFLPTICALAGIEVPSNLDLDGEDMSEALLGQSKQRTKPLMWQWRYKIFGHVLHKSPMLAIRYGKWKLLTNPNRTRIELYDIPNDPSEMNNLSNKNPEVVKKLMQIVLSWHKSLPDAANDKSAGSNTYPWPGR
jgi:N-acetylgalactosamine-6-sulfatase